MVLIDEKAFSELLQSKLGSHWERALNIFKNYGHHLDYDVTNVLLHAVDRDKVEEVLSIMEEHYQNHLQYQHPEIRGTVANFGFNPTEEMFSRICREVLKLESIE